MRQNTSTNANALRRTVHGHPFSVGWEELCRAIKDSEATGQLRISNEALYLLDMLRMLEISAVDPEFPNELKKLVGRDQYYSTVYEMSVFAGYKEMGQSVEFVPLSNFPREKSPDLRVTTTDDETVYIECKSLLNDIKREERAWTEVAIRIVREFGKINFNGRVHITPDRLINNYDIEPLVNFVREKLSLSCKSNRYCFNGFVIDVEELFSSGEKIQLPVSLKYDKRGRGWMETEIDSDGISLTSVRAVEMQPYLEKNQRVRLADLLRSASKQLSKAHPGVIHINIPYSSSEHFLDVVEDSRATIEDIISRRPHICVVVLSGRFINSNKAQSDVIFTNHYVVVPNFKAGKKLPLGFRVLGSEDYLSALGDTDSVDLTNMPDGRFDVSPEGAVLLEFSLNEPLANKPGQYIVRYCSADGRRQIGVWQTFNNLFQIEVVHESFGRRELTVDLNHLSADVVHKMCFSWSYDGISLAVNGKMISSSNRT